jgi:hypothetical protein
VARLGVVVELAHVDEAGLAEGAAEVPENLLI